jgi:hypothetical protein
MNQWLLEISIGGVCKHVSCMCDLCEWPACINVSQCVAGVCGHAPVWMRMKGQVETPEAK